MRMHRREFVGTMGLAAGALGMPFAMGEEKKMKRPNILLILADDMGYSDLGCYGSEVHTPTLNGLAENGLRFTQFYNTARCCPSRAALLTGLYSHQAGVGFMVGDYHKPGYRGFLNDECVTVAEVLRPAGYHTLMSGKWHVGEEHPHWPMERGFDDYYGLISGGTNYWKLDKGRRFARGNEFFNPDAPGFYITDAFTNNALRMLDEHGQREDPFFLYLAFTAPHWPLHAWPEDIAKYRGKFRKGWDQLRRERYARMKERGIIDPAWELTPRDEIAPAWENLSAEKQDEMDLRMAVYCAQIDRMDQNIARVVAKLREMGQLDDTLILFLSDNGGCAEGGPLGFDRAKGEIGTKESFSSYGLSWANASNTPFRRYKHWVHEGGISTPLIAHWPAGMQQHGTMTHQPGHIIDLMATCADVAGAEYPKELGGKPIHPLEGKSLLPILQGKQREGHEAIYWEHEGNRAVRMGKWKIVSDYPGAFELYDMEKDRTEMHNLADAQPERVAAMAARYEAWAKRSNVLPWPVYGTVGSLDKEFTFGPGERREKNHAPRVFAVPFIVEAKVGQTGEGVLIAQGATAVGWSLFVENGRPAFAVRGTRQGLTVVRGKQTLSAPCTVTGRLLRDGKVQLSVDGKVVAEAGGHGLIERMPDDDLSVGEDNGKAVADYETPFRFTGTLKEVKLELDQ